MAEVIDELKYESMIDGLRSFASNVRVAITDLQTIANTTIEALGEDEESAKKITESVTVVHDKYEDVCAEAERIASLMQEELDEFLRQQREAWESDDIDDSE